MISNEFYEYETKLRNVYRQSDLMFRYTIYFVSLQEEGILNDVMVKTIPKSYRVVYPISIVKTNIFPDHLIYSSKDITVLSYGHHELMDERELKNLVKKELLRKIFLFVLNRFLNESMFNVDFYAYRYFWLRNTIEFTTEHQFSDEPYKAFFKINNFKNN